MPVFTFGFPFGQALSKATGKVRITVTEKGVVPFAVQVAIVSGVRHVWTGYVGLRHAKTENEDLKRQLAVAQIQLQEQRALADRSRGLERLLQLLERRAQQLTVLATAACDARGGDSERLRRFCCARCWRSGGEMRDAVTSFEPA